MTHVKPALENGELQVRDRGQIYGRILFGVLSVRCLLGVLVICTAMTGCVSLSTQLRRWGFTQEVAAAVRHSVERRDGLAVFDADGTLWREDAGEAFFLWQLNENILEENEASRVGALWREYKKGLIEDGKIWREVVKCQSGLSAELVDRQARDHFERYYKKRIFEPMRRLVALLHQYNVEVWVVSASQRAVVVAGVRHLGIPEDRVIAVTPIVEDGVLTNRLLEPISLGAGKAEWISSFIRKKPAIVFGNSGGDLEMLEQASHAAVVINPTPMLERAAHNRGWSIQRFGYQGN